MSIVNSARDEILGGARAALHRQSESPVASLPSSARVAPRVPSDPNGELELLLNEIGKLGGITRRVTGQADFANALRELAQHEKIKRATLWETPDLQDLGVSDRLRALGIEIVSPHADKNRLVECDLGITGVDAALPETGTLVLRSSAERPRLVSLLPRVHLAIVHPAALRQDLGAVFAGVKNENYFVFVTGPSRTADIELTVTIGVHGPHALYVWAWDRVSRDYPLHPKS